MPATTRLIDDPPPPPARAASVAQVCYSHAVLTVRGVVLEVVERGQGRPILWLHGEEGLDPQAPFLDLLAGAGRMTAPASRSRNGACGSDRKSTRLNSSHVAISYAVFCLKKKKPS